MKIDDSFVEHQKALWNQFEEQFKKFEAEGIKFVSVDPNMRHINREDVELINFEIEDKKSDL